ncbi:MAG: hypothetical protein Q7J32_05515 [Sphingomonadaceae bacterium]|nr:hypothetical protein [Sphingomonadaceae bacterium]
MPLGRVAAALLAVTAAGCSTADDPDASGLNAAEKAELVERYYACARQQDARCVTATLHSDFRAEAEAAGADVRSGHAGAMTGRLASARVELRILPHEGEDVWVVELWNDRYGRTTSLLRAFTFDDRLILRKSVLAT